MVVPGGPAEARSARARLRSCNTVDAAMTAAVAVVTVPGSSTWLTAAVTTA